MTQRELPPQSTYEMHVAAHAQELVELLQDNPNDRLFIGITGGPAAGKSTFATDLAAQINQKLQGESALVVPMDGFHRYNEDLKAHGLWEVKGTPITFNAQRFIELLQAIQNYPDQVVTGPLFDRTTDEPVEGALVITPHHRLIIVEGNYLLYDQPPWEQARDFFTEVWYLETPEAAVIPRLRDRHVKRGLVGVEIDIKITSTDMLNAQLIEETKARAHRVLHIPQDRMTG